MIRRAANIDGTRGAAWLSLLSAAGLAACSAVTPVPTDVASPGMPNPEVALRQSMQTVAREVSGLGGMSPPAVAAASAPLPPRPAGPVLPEPLGRTVSFEWNGPLDEGVARLAQTVGYTFFVTAPQGNTPVAVAVSVRDVPASEAFRALGEAAGSRATVRLVPSRSQVQVVYGG